MHFSEILMLYGNKYNLLGFQKKRVRVIVFNATFNNLSVVSPVQSVPIIATVVRSNPIHCELYLIEHYGIGFVSDLRQNSGFHWFPSPIKLTTTI
jgi:hypothetical protein